MSHIEENMIRAGFLLPDSPVPAGLYLPAIVEGNMVYTSGQLPLCEGRLVQPGGEGSVGESNCAEAAKAAETALLNALAAIKCAAGSLDRIDRIVRLTVYVASDSGFSGQHFVANGASALLGKFFGEKGRHVRSAVGVASLPIGASVELELVATCRNTAGSCS